MKYKSKEKVLVIKATTVQQMVQLVQMVWLLWVWLNVLLRWYWH